MAGEYEFGTGSAFLNWFIKRQVAGRAVIAASEAEYQRHITDIRAQLSIRDVQRYTNENLAAVAQLATQHGMDVPTYGLFVLKKADAYFAAMAKSYEKYLEGWFGSRQKLLDFRLEQQRAQLEGDKKRLLNSAEVEKARDDLTTEHMDNEQTLRLAELAKRKAFESRTTLREHIVGIQAKVRATKRRTDIDADERADLLHQYDQELTDSNALLESLREKPKEKQA